MTTIPIPEKFNIQDDLNGYVITWRWFKWTHIFMLFFCVLWFGFLTFWYTMAFQISESESSAALNIMFLFPLIHVAAGVGIAYSTLCGFLNKTSIGIINGQLIVKHFPLPWVGSCTVDRSSIGQFYVTEQRRRSKHSTRISYGLDLVKADGRNKKLIRGLPDVQSVKFLENRLEARLGITNTEVLGEFK